MSIVIEFEGHGVWGVGGGGLPSDGVYQGAIKNAEIRGSRLNPDSEKKLYWSIVFPDGYELYQNATLPGPGKKPGVEKAFVRFLLAAGVFNDVDGAKAGGLKGKKVTGEQIVNALNSGKSVWLDFKAPRGRGDRDQTTYLMADEVEAVKDGTAPIKDGRAPYEGGGTTQQASAKAITLPGATASMGAPTTAQPPVAEISAVESLLSL